MDDAQPGAAADDTVAPPLAMPPEEVHARAAAATRKPRAKAKAKATPRRKPVRWSKPRRTIFLRTLGQCANVAEACRASGLSDTMVYRKRRQEPDFLAEWQEALREGVARLEAEMLDRALNGVEKEVWHGGKQVGSVRQYNDGLALALLRAHGPSAGRPQIAPATAPDAAATVEQLREETRAWLTEMTLRMGGSG